MDPERLTQVETTANFGATGSGDAERSAAASGPRTKPHWLDDARRGLPAPGRYLAYEDSDRHVVVPVSPGVTRVGRSVGAELRFDDTTVSRRHAVVAVDDEGVRVLDDRSLNGIMVNGARVDSVRLRDGDEIRVGRHSIWFLDTTVHPASDSTLPALSAPSAF